MSLNNISQLRCFTLDQSFEDDCIQFRALLFRVVDGEEVPVIKDLLDLIGRLTVNYSSRQPRNVKPPFSLPDARTFLTVSERKSLA